MFITSYTYWTQSEQETDYQNKTSYHERKYNHMKKRCNLCIFTVKVEIVPKMTTEIWVKYLFYSFECSYKCKGTKVTKVFGNLGAK